MKPRASHIEKIKQGYGDKFTGERTAPAQDWEKPGLRLLVRLGAIAVHAQEWLGPGGHPIDGEVIRSLLQDAELLAWLQEGENMALLPLKRRKHGEEIP